jgi:hypothetical protein
MPNSVDTTDERGFAWAGIVGAASHLLVHRLKRRGVNLHDNFVGASDRLRELLTARWFPVRVQNGSVHGVSL